MFVVRPVLKSDLDQLYEISAFAKAGLTTFPHDRDVLEQRVEQSIHSFGKNPKKPGGETYFFVLEDTETKRVVGTCALISKVGGFQPFYTYKIKTAVKESKILGVKKEIQYLQLVKNHSGPSEIGTLFLLPDFRKKGSGRLLSLSRFLFIAQYSKCFETNVLAELRGVLNDDDRSPFWNGVCKHFFEVEFKKADLMVMKDKTFIEDLIPEHPIYIPLLPLSAQAVIGKVHQDTEPALHMLEKEGFKPNGEIDIFEAGPVVEAKCSEIRTVRESREATVIAVTNDNDERRDGLLPYLVVNATGLSAFRATLANLEIRSQDKVVLTSATAEALNIKKGQKIRYATSK